MVSESTEFKGGAEAKESAAAFGDRVRSAVIWRSGSQILAQLVTWSVTLVVIRLRDPADYGQFALTQVTKSFLAVLYGWGFESAFMQSDRSQDGSGGKQCVWSERYRCATKHKNKQK